MRNLVTRTDKKIRYFAMLKKNESIFERKSDARKKIMLGGLLVKAGFDHMHPHDFAGENDLLEEWVSTVSLNVEHQLL